MSTFRKVLVSAFILVNFLAMVRTHVPLDDGRFWEKVYKPVDVYLSFFSIYQDWYMFAPNVGKYNNYLSAKVEFLDGSKADYDFPRAIDMNFFDKYSYGEKFRKISSEGIRKDENSFMWKDTAKYVLRKIRETHFDKIPAKVHLIRHWYEIPDVKKEFRKHGSRIEKFESFQFYTYEVI